MNKHTSRIKTENKVTITMWGKVFFQRPAEMLNYIYNMIYTIGKCKETTRHFNLGYLYESI